MANTDYKVSRDSNIYVIANLPTEYKVKYKFYSDINTAVEDAPPGSCIKVEAGSYTLSGTVTFNKNLNVHFEAGAVVNMLNYIFNINNCTVNITGFAELTGSGASIVTISNSISPVFIRLKSITQTTTAATGFAINSSGYIDLKVERIVCTGAVKVAITYSNSDSTSIYEIGYTNGQIGYDNTATATAITTTIKNTYVESSQSALGVVDIYNGADITAKFINCRLYNTSSTATASGISNEVSAGAVIVKLINSVIQTTHASSLSVDSDTALTLMAFGSGANKAVGSNVTESVTGGLLVEADITV